MNNFIKTATTASLGSIINVNDAVVDTSQKQVSLLLQRHGWKKDYNRPGEWRRVCKWEYLSNYRAKKYGPVHARHMIRAHAGDRQKIKDSAVNFFAGMPMSRAMIDVTMSGMGWHRHGEYWYRGEAWSIKK